MEIEDPNIVPGHHHTMREVQRLFVNQVITRETLNVTIDNPDGGIFALGFIDPKTGTNYVGSRLNTNCSAWEFNIGVKDFYSKVYNFPINVVKTMYDENGDVTIYPTKSVKSVFSL